jgi:hypothetical protein
MRLIAELYTHNQIPEVIVSTCLVSLLDEVIDINIDILSEMILKIGGHVVKRS